MERNASQKLTPTIFEKLFPHFLQNLEETCLMRSDGVLKVIDNGDQNHHDKNFKDDRYSITMLRSGSAAGSYGTVCFIENGKEVNKYFTAQKLVQKYGLPEVSAVFINEICYIDDVTWEKVVAVIAPGIRKIPMSL